MDIQGYIIDHWLGKMSAEKPVLIIYDRNALYHSVLPLAEEKGVKVIDTTKGLLHARLAASRFWCGELAENNDFAYDYLSPDASTYYRPSVGRGAL